MNTLNSIPANVQDKFEFYNYHHAMEIISNAFPNEWKDIMDTLSSFKITIDDLAAAGGSETNIPGKIDSVLYPRKWRNVQISGDLHIRLYERIIDQKQYDKHPSKESMIPNYVTGQQIDFLKGRVAFYLEWNKKDLAFDRVINDIRTLFDCNLISAAVILTRGESLNEAFKEIQDSDGKPIMRKYGASSTWVGRLLPKLDARQAGGCPVFVIGIKKTCIEGY